MSTYTLFVNGTPVTVEPSDVDLANARTMLDRFAEPETRASFAVHMVGGLDANVAVWVDVYGERVAVAMARIALAVGEVHTELVAGRQS